MNEKNNVSSEELSRLRRIETVAKQCHKSASSGNGALLESNMLALFRLVPLDSIERQAAEIRSTRNSSRRN